jgi:aminoglycoside phosphotransferase (APT) family kinase protein
MDAVVAYVSAVLAGWSADCVTAVEPLPRGENHAVWKLSCADVGSVVVRVATSERARERAVAEREASAMGKAQGLAAPLLHDFRVENEWFDGPVMCLDFIHGEQRPPQSLQDFERLGATVAQVHDLPTDDLDGWPTDGSTIDGYLRGRLQKMDQRMPWARDPLPASIQDRVHRARIVVDQVAREAREGPGNDEPLALMQGDVAGGNIIWTPDPVLIDWEYTRIGDPADEIAYVFAQHDSTDDQRAAFWRGYGSASGRSLDHVQIRTHRWEPITTLASTLFWLELWTRRAEADAAGVTDPAAPREQAHYEKHVVQRLDRLER